MGAFQTYLQAIRAAQNGPIPIGGTFFPTNEGFPLVPGIMVIGGSFPVPDIATLADIPYDILALNMEVRVVNGDGLNNSVKYYLTQLPPAEMRISEIPGYDITDFWSIVEDGGGGDPVPGPPGDKGWTPVIVGEDDGPNRSVLKVTGFIGGTGTPPPGPTSPNNYIGLSGYTSKSLALNVKGAAGPAAASRPAAYYSVGTRCKTPPSVAWSTGNWQFSSDTLEVSNDYDSPRIFIIYGEMPVANDSGSDSWGVRLHAKNNSTWGPISDSTTVDENYGREDFVSANGNNGVSSVHKISVRHTISIAANSKMYYRLAMRQTNGGGSKYENGFIEAFGI